MISEMALVTQAAALCVIAALLGLVLRRSNPEITLLLALAAAAAVLLALAEPPDGITAVSGTAGRAERCLPDAADAPL
ncbi:MAG: SpoIIIAC/SpoIIIAD family protein [Dysosmobacter sp.]